MKEYIGSYTTKCIYGVNRERHSIFQMNSIRADDTGHY